MVVIFSIPLFLMQSFKSNKLNSKSLSLNNINLYQENKVFIQENWFLTIQKLDLIKVPIREKVTEETLEKYIGHFPTTAYLNGNICLAAHNAGFSVNHFQKLSQLENGDEIEYTYGNYTKKYVVKNKNIIDERDFTSLIDCNYDKLTLITCISGSPSKRLCIEAIYKE